MPRLGVRHKLLLAVAASVLLAGAAIAAVLYGVSRQRLYDEAVRRSEQMVQAASPGFAQAAARGDEVLLDALVHELQSRPELHVLRAWVLDTSGRVLAHTRVDEYGKVYPPPPLLSQSEREALTSVEPLAEESAYRVGAVLQQLGETVGVLVVVFDSAYLETELQAELATVLGTTLPVLVLSAGLVLVLGGRLVRRLQRLQAHTVHVGRGDWDAPLPEEGDDEITDLVRAFNQMQRDLAALRRRDREAAQTIEQLNRELRQRLEQVEQLREQLAEENAALRQQLGRAAGEGPGEIIGAEGGLREVMSQAAKLAPLPVNVLVTGESGTGKELLAAYLHRHSGRTGPLVSVNCAALPAGLIESELFGHEKGAFTDARARRKGRFELAQGGTLFLDEVGEMPPEAQARLLRVLQERELYRVGGEEPVQVDVRIIAATHRELAREVVAGRFREDLYFRLKVAELRLPPLRERLQDLPALAQFFVERYARELERPVVGISPTALRRLAAHAWPGNVRELENAIARAVALAENRVLGPDDFAFLAQGGTAPGEGGAEGWLASLGLDGTPAWQAYVEACERVYLEAVLSRCGSQKEAARVLGLSAAKMHRLVRKYGLRPGPRDFESKTGAVAGDSPGEFQK